MVIPGLWGDGRGRVGGPVAVALPGIGADPVGDVRIILVG